MHQFLAMTIYLQNLLDAVAPRLLACGARAHRRAGTDIVVVPFMLVQRWALPLAWAWRC